MKKYLLVLSVFCFSNPIFASHDPDVLVVRYGSNCCGTSSTSNMINYLNQFELKHNLADLDIQKVMWGYEGDSDLKINIQTLSTKLRTELLAGLQLVIDMQNQFGHESDGSRGYVEINPDNYYAHYGAIQDML